MKQIALQILVVVLVGMFLFGCKDIFEKEPKINSTVAEEAHKLVADAENLYTSAYSQKEAILADPLGKDRLASIKSKKTKLESMAADFNSSKEKFSRASVKFTEAMSGEKPWKSHSHLKFHYLSEAYQKWAEQSDVERQMAQEAINIKDFDSFMAKVGELEAKSKKLREEVDKKIKQSRRTN